MKKLFSSFFIFIFFISSFGDVTVIEQDEVEILRELIRATQKNLNEQKTLLKLLVEYNQIRATFVEEPTSAKIATDLVTLAMRISQKIEKENLIHLFSSDFLTEIRFFNQVGQQHERPHLLHK
ncbi:MAG: hypothetical protein WAM28_07635 [Chlamydiales bacterium]